MIRPLIAVSRHIPSLRGLIWANMTVTHPLNTLDVLISDVCSMYHGRLLGQRLLYLLSFLMSDRMTSEFHGQQVYDAVSYDAYFEPSGILDSIPSNAIVIRGQSDCSVVRLYLNVPDIYFSIVDQVAFYQELHEASGSGRTMFQLIRNNHEVIIWGPPVVALANLTIQLELIVCDLDIPRCPKRDSPKH